MKHKQPKDGAPGTTDQWPRWEGPQGSKPAGYLRAKDDVEKSRDANSENLNDPKVRRVSDALKQKGDD
ncbi:MULTISPECIES: hypothetical protein [unclassified Sinorhizobium]|uniref:hypothetical protein n=1 Tax=unclassified Sinorhizobium TaxID=2613772 RepID=UPI0035265C45